MNKPIKIALLSYLVLVLLAETIISYSESLGLDPKLGSGIYITIVLAILLYSFLFTGKNSVLISSLAFPPLIRIMSTSLVGFKFISLIIIINSLLILTAYLFIKNNNIKPEGVGFITGDVKWQLCIGMTGILFGYTEYLILGSQVELSEAVFPTFIAYGLALLVFTGFSEEFMFRGIILTSMENVLGRNYSLILTSFLFAVMHIVWKNPLDLLFVFLVALFYGHAFQRTRSLFGITLSHGITNIMLFLVLPAI